MDIRLKETGQGGDYILKNNDLFTTDGIFNQVYMALFGGNIQQVTPVERPANEEQFDWWGNRLLLPNQTQQQLNSLTERTLNEVQLNSTGRTRIAQAVSTDLNFMRSFAELTIEVTIPTVDTVQIRVHMQEPENKQGIEFIYLWDATRNEVIDPNDNTSITVVDNWILANSTWNDSKFWDDNSFWKDN